MRPARHRHIPAVLSALIALVVGAAAAPATAEDAGNADFLGCWQARDADRSAELCFAAAEGRLRVRYAVAERRGRLAGRSCRGQTGWGTQSGRSVFLVLAGRAGVCTGAGRPDISRRVMKCGLIAADRFVCTTTVYNPDNRSVKLTLRNTKYVRAR